MQVEGATGHAPPEFNEAGSDQLNSVPTEELIPQAMQNVVNDKLLESFPGRNGKKCFALNVLEAAGFGFDGASPDHLHWSYGIMSNEFRQSGLHNATTLAEARSMVKDLDASDVESIVLSCDYPGATFHTGPRKSNNLSIPGRGWGRQTPTGSSYTITSLVEATVTISHDAPKQPQEKCFLATLDAAIVIVRLQHLNGVCTPRVTSLVLFHTGPLGQLADARTHVERSSTCNLVQFRRKYAVAPHRDCTRPAICPCHDHGAVQLRPVHIPHYIL